MIELLEKLLDIDEARKDELYKQFVTSGKVPEDIFNTFVKTDPTHEKQKYLQWKLKQYLVNKGRVGHINDVVVQFERLASSNKIKGEEADIFRYTLDNIDGFIEDKLQQKTKGEVKREEKSDSTKVKETEDYLIVVPNSYKASCFYGANTKWCISGKTTGYWEQYWFAGVKIYIIIDKKKNKKYAVAVYADGKKECYNEEDIRISFEKLRQHLGF